MCPRHIGAFEYTLMPFGLRNAGATYQRAMNSIFHDMIGHSLEVYIDDVVVKSPEEGDHVSNLKRAFLRMRQHKLKMNPKKCVFAVQAGNFLGFLVHQKGIEIDKNKAKSIIEALPPRNKKAYVPQKAVKGQAVADFLADHPGEEIENMDSLDIANADLLPRAHTCLNNPIYSVHLTPWKLYFDGSKIDVAYGAGIVLEEPLEIRHLELGIQSMEILGDSMLVLKQIAGKYKGLNPSLAVYLVAVRNLLTEFREATWEHILREENFAAKEMAHIATGIQMPEDCVQRIIKYLTLPYEKRVRIMALNYLMWNGDLVRKAKDELIKRYGYVWPTMMKDCINYSKGCEACQRHGLIQQAPSVAMNPVVKPWPFRGWAMDLISKIYPTSNKQHCFIIVATDYFTKWVEAKPVKSTTSQEIITFIEEQIIQRFGILESITTNKGSSFISGEMLDMAEAFKFKLLQSTPYNGSHTKES
ncbi:hypothetical protein L3X38_036569 [Prunus dulcis]|uniref:Uncharacterized protein n=1 Tax=Prunus dulcis TaxID=3755 RepID=A0AAD4V3S2_PRUDU|nr:hypothetical protein L3X38_036569 [Prunus dulcis]